MFMSHAPRRGDTPGLSSTAAKMDVMSIASDPLIAGLDDQQREAVLAPRGPVCVLAGAGTGKTRTITHRIASLVASGHVAAGQVLAVTFTQRAAGEMRSRLRALDAAARTGSGVGAVQALTFHAAAYRQLRYFWSRVIADTGWQLLDSKFAVVARAASRTRLHASTDDVRDLAGEIEWAKASLIGPEEYVTAVAAARRDPRWTPRKSRLSTPNTRRSRPAATASPYLTSTTCCCTPRPRLKTTPRWPRSSRTGTGVSSWTSTRTSPPAAAGALGLVG